MWIRLRQSIKGTYCDYVDPKIHSVIDVDGVTAFTLVACGAAELEEQRWIG
ncbi:hypothetical protein [Mycolicibacterium sp. CBMA 226]|uniref:hypothetical protein n=1 Tax=Mycolicibacterium sp. CBMA 226 TaxID=2606611 RepID=UPI0012DE97FC|nr:hypothetical protein [Mycolicibacterium sp. CBMA 226]